MNEITIVGRLARDPEQKASTTGKEFTTFTVASSRYAGKDKDNATDFFSCICSGERGLAISRYFKKGDQIMVIGEMSSQKGKKEDTKNVTYWNVNVSKFEFGAKKNGAATSSESTESEVPSGFEKIDPDDIPF